MGWHPKNEFVLEVEGLRRKKPPGHFPGWGFGAGPDAIAAQN
jgi:hypothetical protein